MGGITDGADQTFTTAIPVLSSLAIRPVALARGARAGANKLRFSATSRGKALPQGEYKLEAIAQTATSLGQTAEIVFKIGS